MKLLKNSIIILLFVLSIVSCPQITINNENNTNKISNTDNTADEYLNGAVDFRLTNMIANNYFENMKDNYEWKDAKIEKFYPIYNPATDKITYLEYKVTEDGKNRGYILVSLKDDEPSIVESSHSETSTCYEILEKKAKTSDIKVYRFSFDSYVAVAKENKRSISGKKVLAAIGNIEFRLMPTTTNNTRNGSIILEDDIYENIVNQY